MLNNITILEAISWGRDMLAKNKSEETNPLLEAQLILSHVLQKPTSYLIAHFEELLSEVQINAYTRLIERRQTHIPVSQLFKSTSFFGRDFFITPHVLTPRPETETMIETAIELVEGRTSIHEIGTGSGAIAITLAAELQTPVIASDISQHALKTAHTNAERHGTTGNVTFTHGHLLEPHLPYVTKESTKALILANLPYLPTHRRYESGDEIKHEPSLALYSGVDGLNHYHELLTQLALQRDHFPVHVELLMEIDPSQKDILPTLTRSLFPHATTAVIPDLSKKARIVYVKL